MQNVQVHCKDSGRFSGEVSLPRTLFFCRKKNRHNVKSIFLACRPASSVIRVVHRRNRTPSGPTAFCPTVMDLQQVRQAADRRHTAQDVRSPSSFLSPRHHRPRGRCRARRSLTLCPLLPLASPSTTTAAHLLQFCEFVL